MRYWFAVAVVVTIALGIAANRNRAATQAIADPAATQCGDERWAVKTLSDSDVGQVDFTPQESTVHDLGSLTRPQALPPDNRIVPTELTTFRIAGYVREMKLEEDHDISVVILDPNVSATMRIEFPDVACEGVAQSLHNAEMAAARQGFINLYGEPPTHSTLIDGYVIVTGVGFFDSLQGQPGFAPNGIELHPVLSFDWPISITPSPLPTPTGTATPIPTDVPLCDVIPPLTPAPGCVGTPTPTKTPTRSPFFQTLYWGDLDCSGMVDALDAISLLPWAYGDTLPQTQPCPHLGWGVMVEGKLREWGVINCGGDNALTWAMDTLRHAAGLDYARTADCPDAGDLVEVISYPFPTSTP